MPQYLVRRYIIESQLVEAENEEEAVEIAAARPDAWEGSGEEYDVEPSNEQEAA